MAFGLNIFRTISGDIRAAGDEVYTAPVNYSAIILSAQICNITGTTQTVSMSVLNPDSSETALIKNFEIPGNDSASALVGKLVLETGYGLVVSAGADNACTLVLSILESKN